MSIGARLDDLAVRAQGAGRCSFAVAAGSALLLALAACAAPAATPTAPPGVSAAALDYAEECAEARRRHGLTLSGVGEEELGIRLRATRRMADSARAQSPPLELAAYHEARVAQWSTLARSYEFLIEGEEYASASDAREGVASVLELAEAMEEALRLEEEAKAALPPALREYVSELCL